MQINSRIQIAIDLLDTFFDTLTPFDILMSKFFKNNKWIGSHDRREIAEFVYSIFRNYEKLKFLTSNITAHFGRFMVLAYLKSGQKLSIDEIRDIFCGRPHCPPPLSQYEEKFLSNLKLSNSLPRHVLCNYPAWMEDHFTRAFGSESVEQEMIAMNKKASLDLRVNTLKSNKETVRKILTASGFSPQDTSLSENCLRIPNGRVSRSHEILQNGLAEIQDEGSQLIAEVCDAHAGDTVVDYCAGAGGKTLAIAAAMQNKGRIFALDKSHERLENAKLRCRKAGVNNVFIQEITSKWIKRHIGCADIVLVDAPCSGTGTWRRNPDMRAKFTQSDLDELIQTQFEILTSASRLVKPGGKLIYATCSVLYDEDEDQINKFVEKFPEFSRQDVKLKHYEGKFLRLTPYRHNTDGFFAAILKFEGRF